MVVVVVIVVVDCRALDSDTLMFSPLVIVVVASSSCGAGTKGVVGGRISLNPGIAILDPTSFPG